MLWLLVGVAIICVARIARALLHNQQVMMARRGADGSEVYAATCSDEMVGEPETLHHTLDDILKEGEGKDVGA